jgi:hypothetical protein
MNNNEKFINEIINKFNNKEVKISGKILYYLKELEVFQFYCILHKLTELNPFSSEIYLKFEFQDNTVPYIQILNDFINPTLNDGRNIFYCLTNQHNYKFNKNNLNEFEILFDEMIRNIKKFLICIKENIQINAFVYYGEFEIGKIYKINELIFDKNSSKFFRIMEINGKNEEMKYIIITQLYFLFFEPVNNDMSLAKLNIYFYLKDILFAFEEINPNTNHIQNNFKLKILLNNSLLKEKLNLNFYIYDNDKLNDNLQTKFIEFKSILFSKKGEIDMNKYKLIITNYRPLFIINLKKSSKKKNNKISHDDCKLYISYFEELFNYFKDFKEENIRNRVQTFLSNITYFCVDFLSFYDSDPEEINLYKNKMSSYLAQNEN